MLRWVIATLLALLVACVVLILVQPRFAASVADRAIRFAERFTPDGAAYLRHGSTEPVETRLAKRGFNLGAPVFIRIFKQEHELEVWQMREGTFTLVETYPICNWSGRLGPKLAEGDGQSPEGFYAVGLKQLNPNSAYYRAFNLGFPNAYDRTYGRSGSFLMVHGDCVSIGCYAMTDKGIDDIYTIVEAALRAGQPQVPVHAFPFRMTEEAMADNAGHRWAAYWANLKEGYDLFETTKTPPPALICGERYAFKASSTEACQPITAW